LWGALVGLEIFVLIFTSVATQNGVMMGNICLYYDHKKWGHGNPQNLFLYVEVVTRQCGWPKGQIGWMFNGFCNLWPSKHNVFINGVTSHLCINCRKGVICGFNVC